MTDEQPEKREEPDEEELERRLQALLGDKIGDSEPAPQEGPDEFELKLREIEEKAESLKSTSRMPEPPEWEFQRPRNPTDPPKDESGSYRGLGVGLMLAYTLVGPLIAGWGIGWLVDRGSNTNTWQTWGTVIGMFAGFIGVVVILSKTGDNKK